MANEANEANNANKREETAVTGRVDKGVVEVTWTAMSVEMCS